MAAYQNEKNFKGFSPDEIEEGQIKSRMKSMESEVETARLDRTRMVERMIAMQASIDEVLGSRGEIVILKNQLEEMRQREIQRNKEEEERTKENEELKKKIEILIKENRELKKCQIEERNIDFREITEQQNQERQENIRKEVVNVLKNNGQIVREEAEKKKSIIVHGIKEKNIPMKINRDKEETKKAKEILKQLNEEEDIKFEEELDEVVRLGPYTEGKVRPMKMRLKSQIATEQILRRAHRLKQSEEHKDVYLKKYRNEEERKKLGEMHEEAKKMNEERTEEDKTKFFWRVLGDRLRKWYIKERI